MRLPEMKPRTGLEEKFSTFLHFEDSQKRLVARWQTDPGLARNMSCVVASNPEAKEEDWARLFLKVIRDCYSATPAGKHLSAYLQEVCFWVAKRIYLKYESYLPVHTELDCFQIASREASEPAKLLKNFNLDCEAPIKNYTQKRLEGKIEDELCKSMQRRRCSDWGLLRRLSKKECRAALLQAGLLESHLEWHFLAWECFKTTYTPTEKAGGRRLPPPTEEQFQPIIERYNQLRSRLSEPGSVVSSKTIQEMLKTCIDAARDYSQLAVSSLDELNYVSEPNAKLPDLLDTLGQVEEQQQFREQVRAVLSDAFAALRDESQKLLKLWLGLGLTQKEILTQEEIAMVLMINDLQKQYQVSRLVDQWRRSLLTALAEWKSSQVPSELPPRLTNDDFKKMKADLDEWLENHCKTDFYSSVTIAFRNNLSADERELLQCYYRQQLDEQARPEANSRLSSIKQQLQESLKHCVETMLNIALPSPSPVDDRINAFVEEWLQNNLPKFID
jgi:hypothetical protein